MNYHDQQFRVEFSNNMLDFDLAVSLYMDGECIYRGYLQAGQRGQIRGIPNTASSILPFKFQELQLVGAFPGHPLRPNFSFLKCY